MMINTTEFEVIDLGDPRARRAPPSATVFTVAFHDDNANRAARVANEMVTQILERNVQIRQSTAENTTTFFRQQVDKLARELTDLEAQIVAFKNANPKPCPKVWNSAAGR